MKGNAIFLMSRIRENANRLILCELKNNGLQNLSPSHGDILVVLFQYKNLTMQDIAKKIHRTKATTTVLVDKLEDAGLVKREKSSTDTRVTNVCLTKQGQDFKPIFEQISDKLKSAVYKNLSEDESCKLELLLEKIKTGME